MVVAQVVEVTTHTGGCWGAEVKNKLLSIVTKKSKRKNRGLTSVQIQEKGPMRKSAQTREYLSANREF